MVINGIDLEFRYFEEQTNKKTVKAQKKVIEAAKKAEDKKSMNEKILILCGGIKEGFDLIFGTGTGTSVCGEENDLKKCSDAWCDALEEMRRQGQELKEVTTKINNMFPAKES